MLAQDRPELREFGGVDLHLGRVAAEHHAIEPRTHVEEQRRRPRDDLLHQRPCLAIEIADRAPRLL